MLLLVDMREPVLVLEILSSYFCYSLLLLLSPHNHGVFKLDGFVIGSFRSFKSLIYSILMTLIFVIEFCYVGLELSVHVLLKSVHVKLHELPRSLI